MTPQNELVICRKTNLPNTRAVMLSLSLPAAPCVAMVYQAFNSVSVRASPHGVMLPDLATKLLRGGRIGGRMRCGLGAALGKAA